MQVSLEAREGLQRQLTISLPGNEISNAVNNRLNELKGTMHMAGFRPGKTPIELIKKRFGDSIRGEVLEGKIKETLQQAFEQQKLEPVFMPTVKVTSDFDSPDFTFEAHFEVFPEIQVSNEFGQVEVQKPTVDIQDADIDGMIAKMREQKATFTPVDRKAQLKDEANIDFEGKIDDVAFPGGAGNGFKLVLGSGSTIPGFEQGIVGKKKGEQFAVDVQFPADYGSKDLAGKKATFYMTLNEVSEPQLPELDDNFAALFDVKEGGIGGLRAQVRQTMESLVNNMAKAKMKEQVWENLLATYDFLLPAVLLQEETKRMSGKNPEQDHEHDHDHDHDHEHCDDPDHDHDHDHAHHHHHAEASPEVLAEAKRRVKLGLLARQLIANLNIKVQRSDLEKKVDEIIKQYSYPDMMKQYLMSNEKTMESLQADVLEDLLVQRILETAKIIEEKTSYDTLVNSQQG
jgi:trigger factor